MVTLWSPGTCCENSVASLLNRSVARSLARSSCLGLFTGSKVEWCIQPNALLLSVNARMCGLVVLCWSSVIDSFIVITAARNSRKLMEARPCSSMGMSNLQPGPCSEKPPNPHSHASEYSIADGRTVLMLFMLIPFVDRSRII